MSYDADFRLSAIEYWSRGHSKSATAAAFKVSASTLQKWKIQYVKNGSLESKKRRDTWRKIDPERLRLYLRKNPDAFLKEVAGEFDCSNTAAFKAIRRIKGE
jgi:transposase-like protein